MTPAEQSALEAVAGRALSPDEIAQIDALLPIRNDVAIAAILTAGQPSRMVSVPVEQVFAALYDSGDYSTLKAAQLQGHPSASFVFAVLADLKTLGPGRVDFASPKTTALLDDLTAATLLSDFGRSELLALATAEAEPIHFNAVSDALNDAQGLMTL